MPENILNLENGISAQLLDDCIEKNEIPDASNADIWIVFLNLLIQELTRAEKNLDTSSKEKNIAETRMILHKLKGTAGSAGLFTISECALKWEKMSEDDMDFCLMNDEIKQEIKTGLQIVKNLIKL